MIVTDIIALGLLAEGPLHGYEIRQKFEQRGFDHFTKLSYGALYHALKKLQDRSLIRKETTERVGQRPERKVFTLTESGRAELERQLVEALTTPERQYYAVTAALSQALHLDAGELDSALRRRHETQQGIVARLEQEVQQIEAHLRQVFAAAEGEFDRPRAMTISMSMIEHALAHERAELEWLDGLLERLDDID